VVFFAGDRAYKLKKPVRTGFLDFSTPQAREQACRRETELNRRFAPDVYLGVAEVASQDGQVCDHLVVMRRMPADRRLSALVAAGRPAADQVRQVARILAAQHARAPRGAAISAQGSRDALARRWRDNIDQTSPLANGLIDAAVIDEVDLLVRRFLDGRAALFDARIRGGRVVDGHGDLLAADIFCTDDGPRILDCLEFDDKLRWLDGLDDAAFLAMDLEALGASGLAGQFLDWYTEFSGDPAPDSLRRHYVAYRAFVRAKVGCLRASQGDSQAGQEAARLAGLALRQLRAGAVMVVLVGGLPGAGKSTLAGALADRLGWTVLSSDRIRRELTGLAAGQPPRGDYNSGIYSAPVTERTYAELTRRAAELTAHGESVILDATWISADRRAEVAAMAGQAAADLVQLRCAAPHAVAAERMTRRSNDPTYANPSDADQQVAARMARRQDPWPDAIIIETAGPAVGEHSEPDLVSQALRAIGRPD
jgi:aminoglycoside phosphotransferase family enzyme/predicted kinase